MKIQKWIRYQSDNIFPLYKLMGVSVAVETKVLIRLFYLPKIFMNLFSDPNDTLDKIWLRLADWRQRYSSLKVWTTTVQVS